MNRLDSIEMMRNTLDKALESVKTEHKNTVTTLIEESAGEYLNNTAICTAFAVQGHAIQLLGALAQMQLDIIEGIRRDVDGD